MWLRRHSLLPLLIAVAVTGQLSCVGKGPFSASRPSASPSPNDQAAIDEILQRYEQALGGKDAIDKITTQKMTGRFTISGMAGNIEGWQKQPHKTLTVVEFPGLGKLKKGFDGETRWVQTPAGTVSDSSPEEIAELERDAEVFSAGRIKSLFDSMKLENKGWLSGRDVYVIEGTREKRPPEKLFFDTETGLLVRWDMARRQAKRTVFVKVHLDDYKDVGGVKMPFKVRFAFESFNFIVLVDKLEYNIPIDDAIFKKP